MCCTSVQKHFKGKCSERALLGLNLLAYAMLVTCIALRFFYVAIGALSPGRSIIFFVVLAIYQLIFIALLTAAEFKFELPRLLFDFLDNKLGRGCMIMFVDLLILDEHNAIIIILFILVFLIAILGMVAGWGKGSDGKKQTPPPISSSQRNKD